MTLPAGTLRSSKFSVQVLDALMPNFCSFFAICMPISFVATKHVIPLYPLLGSIWHGFRVRKSNEMQEKGHTLANMRKISASYEFVIHILEPLMIQLSPSFFARVCNANASDPDADSDKQNDPSYQ